ncbi:MAG: nucleotidyltransferase domain-containing protein [Spirochaetes bacterium]|nr:nucleotidyltransferase domain-containing protein [Spirochaetota bacterium]
MPVRSLDSAVLRWPDRRAVLEKAREWAETTGRGDPSVVSILCHGSMADGTWGVGSDLDIMIEVRSSAIPFESRPLEFTPPDCGVPVDMTVYTTEELEGLRAEKRRFTLSLDRSSIALYRSAA